MGIYNFSKKGKILFWIAGFICFISLVGIPFGLLFFLMASRAKIELTTDSITYTMLRTKKMPYSEIIKMWLEPPKTARYYVHVRPDVGIFVNTATVLPLIIEGKKGKIKLSLNYFDNAPEILTELQRKAKKKVEHK